LLGNRHRTRARYGANAARSRCRNSSDHGSEFIIESARSKNFDRPWSPAPAPREAFAETSGESGQADIGTRARDATPRQEDIEADQ
jgi:hypothetical protein